MVTQIYEAFSIPFFTRGYDFKSKVNEKSPNNKYPRDKTKALKRASLDHGICEICEGEFRASYNFEKDLKCELIWAQRKGKMILVCDECKKEVEGTK